MLDQATRSCALAGCSNTYPRGRRGPYSHLCPQEHANKNGLALLHSQRETSPVHAAPERTHLERVALEVAGEPDPTPSLAARGERISGLLGLERAVARVYHAEAELKAARQALRLAYQRGASASGRGLA